MTALARRWRALPPAERRLTVRAAAIVPRVELGLHLSTLPALCDRLGIRLQRTNESDADPSVNRVAAVGAAEWKAASRVLRRWPAGDTCLRRSLVAGRLLCEHEPVLRFGVDRDGDPVRAHAWLEIDHAPVGEVPGPFVPLRGPA